VEVGKIDGAPELWFNDAYGSYTRLIIAGAFNAGFVWNQPFDWANRSEQMPRALTTALDRHMKYARSGRRWEDPRMGRGGKQIWYINDQTTSFIMSPQQQNYWCHTADGRTASCVGPDWVE